MKRRHVGLVLLAFVAATPVRAGDVKAISAGAVRGLIAGMIEDYTRETGQKFEFTVGTTGQLRAAIESGKPADLIISSAPLMGELEKTGKMMAGSRIDLGRIGMGVAIRDGAPAPDVSTPDAFRKALLDAKSVAYTGPAEGGTSGIYVMNLLKRFDITDAVEKKAVHANGGRDAVDKVVSGEADFAVTLISEIIPVKGARLAAALPESLQLWTVYAAAIPAASTEPAAARAFIAALTSPAMAGRWKAAGFEPPGAAR